MSDILKTDLTKALREAKAEIAEDREIKERLIKELDDAKQKNAQLHERRVHMYFSLIQERRDLDARILRIDQRIQALGFEPPSKEKP